jgi:hypothetical protein
MNEQRRFVAPCFATENRPRTGGRLKKERVKGEERKKEKG